MPVFTQAVPRDIRGKLFELNWSFVLLIILTGCIGILMLYSVAGGAWDPWAIRHATTFLPPVWQSCWWWPWCRLGCG